MSPQTRLLYGFDEVSSTWSCRYQGLTGYGPTARDALESLRHMASIMSAPWLSPAIQ